jgi:hypothetical protein
MRKKTSKALKTKSEPLGKSSQATICSSFLGISPNSQGISKQSTEQQNGGISAKKPEFEATISRESAKFLELKTEFSGNSLQTTNSSDFQPKAPKLQSFPNKPQISTIPGMSPKERSKYRVMLGDEILGDFLTIDEALKLVKGGAK